MTKASDSIERQIKGLNFLSETDDLWSLFLPTARRKGAVTSATMKELTGLAFEEMVDFDAFFEHTIQSQTISQGAAVGERYKALRNELTALLTVRKVFKMRNSPHNFEYYVVGFDKDQNLVGCNVTSVET